MEKLNFVSKLFGSFSIISKRNDILTPLNKLIFLIFGLGILLIISKIVNLEIWKTIVMITVFAIVALYYMGFYAFFVITKPDSLIREEHKEDMTTPKNRVLILHVDHEEILCRHQTMIKVLNSDDPESGSVSGRLTKEQLIELRDGLTKEIEYYEKTEQLGMKKV